MMIGENLKTLRTSRRLTLEELANNLNELYPETVSFNKGKLSKWENGREEPKLSSLRIVADYFGVTINDLISKEITSSIIVIYNQLNSSRQKKVYNFAEYQLKEQNKDNNKVVQLSDYVEETMSGYLSAGTGEFLTDEVNEKVKIPKAIVPAQDYDLVLQVNGDSMQPMFEDHEYVFIKKTNEIRSGQIGVFIIDGESYLKKVYIEDSHLRLVSLNKKYKDLRFNDVNDIKLIGSVVL